MDSHTERKAVATTASGGAADDVTASADAHHRPRAGAGDGGPPRPAPSLRTVLLIAPWYGGARGGVAVSTETVAGALTRSGFTVVVLVLNGQPAHRGRFGEHVFPVAVYGKDVRDQGLRGRLGYWRRLLGAGAFLAWLVARYRIRVAHFHYCHPAFAALRAWLRLLRVPIVVTFRGSDVHTVEAGSLAEAEGRAMVHAARRVTAVSERLLDAVHQHFPEARAKSTVVLNAVPLDVWETEAAAPPLEGRDIDVLYLGNIHYIKGPDLLVEAFKGLLATRPAASLYFLGSGDMEDEIRRAVDDAGLAERVVFAGRVPRSEVSGWLGRTRVLALPSRAEGLPLAALEAQRLGVPVVACAVGGVPQAVIDGQTGLLVEWGDAEGFARALRYLLENPREWRAYSARSREWVASQFSPVVMARRYAALYAAVTGTAAGTAAADAPVRENPGSSYRAPPHFESGDAGSGARYADLADLAGTARPDVARERGGQAEETPSRP
jgi:glycosyltransferase involved in cell wall biosynthesis